MEAAAWGGLIVLFVGVRVGMLLFDPARFWAVEETYQADIAVALHAGTAVEPLPTYLYPTSAGASLIDGLLVAALSAFVGPSWWVLKGLALGIALLASAVLVAGVRFATGRGPALLLGLLLALGPPSWASLQLMLHGNHAEAALPVALSAVGTWALLERDRSDGGRIRLAAALGLVSGLGLFAVYSHQLVILLQVLLIALARPKLTVRLAAAAAVGLAVGLVPWVACRLYLSEPLTFASHAGSGLRMVGHLVSEPGRLGEALAALPWLGQSDGRPWADLMPPSLQATATGLSALARWVLLLALPAAVALGASRWRRGVRGWVLPLFFGLHGIGLFLLLAGAQLAPRYAQALVIDGLVTLTLVVTAVARRGGRFRLAALVLVVPLVSSALDTSLLLGPPQAGGATFAREALVRFSRGRQSAALQGFSRPALPRIAAWLERPPGDADIGFALGFHDAGQLLSPRAHLSHAPRVTRSLVQDWSTATPLDRRALFEGLGAAAVVRWGGLEPALTGFDGTAEERESFAIGARWMAERL